MHTEVVMVSDFDPLQLARKAKVINGTIKYMRCNTEYHLILVVNQAILVPEIDNCLLCPVQFRMNELEICNVPRFLTPNLTTSTHSIMIANILL